MIGKLEEIVLLACLRAGQDALPSVVFEIVHNAAPKPLASFASVYTTMGRLAKKGLLRESEISDAQGRSRRSFSVTGSGQQALRDALNATRDLGGFVWTGGAYA